MIRYAPSFSQSPSSVPETDHAKYPYTIQTLAGFLGFVQPDGQSLRSFEAAFGAVELIEEGYLTDARIKDLELFKISEVVKLVKQEKTKALAEAKRLTEEAEARRKEAERELNSFGDLGIWCLGGEFAMRQRQGMGAGGF